MPVEVEYNIMQDNFSWMLRMTLFICVGLVVGYLFDKIKRDYRLQIKKSYQHYITGYPNFNKLRADLKKRSGTNLKYSMLIFDITNLDYINRYVDDYAEKEMVAHFTGMLCRYFEKGTIYCISMKKFVIVKYGISQEQIYEKALKFLENFEQPVLVNGIHADLYVKCGIVSCPENEIYSDELIKKMFRTLDQKPEGNNEIRIYKSEVARKNQENYEKLIELYDALSNDEFYLMYQPKVDVKNNSVMGLEALIRWKNPKFGQVSPEDFIALAENVGLINEITKWVVSMSVKQIKQWKEQGLEMKVAINVSSKDLKDESIIAHTLDCIEKNHINPGLLEFELTERTIMENEDRVHTLLDKIRDMGLKISLDDFGTGYNSLIHLVNLPIDYVKLDKFFISRIKESKGKPLVQGVINTVHMLGKQIIAEGVETEEQVSMLVNMGCDNIQGYYYSKPLMPEDVLGYIKRANACA